MHAVSSKSALRNIWKWLKVSLIGKWQVLYKDLAWLEFQSSLNLWQFFICHDWSFFCFAKGSWYAWLKKAAAWHWNWDIQNQQSSLVKLQHWNTSLTEPSLKKIVTSSEDSLKKKIKCCLFLSWMYNESVKNL